LLIALSSIARAQSLSPNWEELSGEDFITAVQQAQGTCILPFGIVEKHGPSGPLGTDLINVRFTVAKAVEKEYAIVFPAYYFGQIFDAQHQPGTIAYSSKLQMQLSWLRGLNWGTRIEPHANQARIFVAWIFPQAFPPPLLGIRCTRTTTLAMPPAPPQPEERHWSNTTAPV
jgi:hypothetical protein